MGKFACFLSGVLAGVVALGAASYLVCERAAQEDIDRDDGDDGCLSPTTGTANPTESETGATA